MGRREGGRGVANHNGWMDGWVDGCMHEQLKTVMAKRFGTYLAGFFHFLQNPVRSGIQKRREEKHSHDGTPPSSIHTASNVDQDEDEDEDDDDDKRSRRRRSRRRVKINRDYVNKEKPGGGKRRQEEEIAVDNGSFQPTPPPPPPASVCLLYSESKERERGTTVRGRWGLCRRCVWIHYCVCVCVDTSSYRRDSRLATEGRC